MDYITHERAVTSYKQLDLRLLDKKSAVPRLLLDQKDFIFG